MSKLLFCALDVVNSSEVDNLEIVDGIDTRSRLSWSLPSMSTMDY